MCDCAAVATFHRVPRCSRHPRVELMSDLAILCLIGWCCSAGGVPDSSRASGGGSCFSRGLEAGAHRGSTSGSKVCGVGRGQGVGQHIKR